VSTTNPPPQLPPDVARFLKGAPPESRQFDFLVGEWDCDCVRYHPDGSPMMQYKGRWSAKSINDGRMIVDDFQVHMPNGLAASSFVTLRTYCETTARWEIVGLAALQPSMISEWHGQSKDGELWLDIRGRDPSGAAARGRVHFFSIDADSFEWTNDLSLDDGATWTKAASLKARRIES
jgi:hypothetical protein